MFFKKINLLILSAYLTGCSVNYNYPEYEQPALQERYGIWDVQECKLKATRADMTVSLTDIYNEDAARILIESDTLLNQTPKVSIFGLEGYDFSLTGAGDTFSIEIPTGMLEQARMHLNQTFLQITYQVKGADYFRRAIFPLQELPKAMLDIKKNCI
tara:strand:- start:3339 stop:3809 length:471 start_codon:yes stop_codon:yes gene_type:complete